MFRQSHGQTSQPSSPLAGKCFWALMVVLHVPSLIASWRVFVQSGLDPGELGGCLGLSASMLFFVLKLRGVACLRFRIDRRSLVAISVAIVLMHADAIGIHLGCAGVPKEVPIAGTTLLAVGLTRVQRGVRVAFSRCQGVSRRRAPAALANDTAWFAAFVPHRRILTACVCIPRAPPT